MGPDILPDIFVRMFGLQNNAGRGKLPKISKFGKFSKKFKTNFESQLGDIREILDILETVSFSESIEA
jgi:hypothetical protein